MSARMRSAISMALAELDAIQQQRKLFATEPCREIERPRALAQKPGDGLQRLIPVKMPIAIVHLLEMIDIEQHETQRCAVRGAAPDTDARALRRASDDCADR